MIALKNILVATDFSATAEMALTYGRALARACGATLHVLHVVDNVFAGPFVADPGAAEELALTRLNSRLTHDDRAKSQARAVVELSHHPAKAIVAYALAAEIDLIVAGTHGRSRAARVLLGSVAEQIVQAAPCPVLTIRRPLQQFGTQVEVLTFKNILVPTDFGEAAGAALTYGRALAGHFDATLHVLHVVDNTALKLFGAETYANIAPGLLHDVEEAARKQLDNLLIDGDVNSPTVKRGVLTSSSPASAIVDYAEDKEIDLIVMGTHGRGAVAHLIMGSVAERVARVAPCPVLTVRHSEVVRPDTGGSSNSDRERPPRLQGVRTS
jgi:nucleotide-binding universal stress UspA family protein